MHVALGVHAARSKLYRHYRIQWTIGKIHLWPVDRLKQNEHWGKLCGSSVESLGPPLLVVTGSTRSEISFQSLYSYYCLMNYSLVRNLTHC